MRVAFGPLRMAPRDFWAMTPREFSAAVRGMFGSALQEPLGREDFAELMLRFPDQAG